MPWMATIDAFQYWVYANPNHSREERAERWLELAERFGPKVDMSGFEEIHKVSWQRQGHLFGVPFYYVEYGIAQLGALQRWKYHRRDTEGKGVCHRLLWKMGSGTAQSAQIQPETDAQSSGL